LRDASKPRRGVVRIGGIPRLCSGLEDAEASLEATTGFEPVNGGFADPCLTTWLRRHIADSSILTRSCQSRFGQAAGFYYNGTIGEKIEDQDIGWVFT